MSALPAGITQTFAALQYPNFRLWFCGQMVSMMGTWMQSTAQGYLIYELTNSPAWLGYVAFASGVPSWLFMLFAGALIDRISRRKVLIIVQNCMMLLAFILAALMFTGLVQAWHILILAFLLGVCNAFDAPARQAFVLEMVDRKHLTNAIALNSMMFNTATVIGPAVGGLVYAWVGPGWCFTINGISFLAVIAALLLMRLQPEPPKAVNGSAISQIGEGLAYIKENPLVRTLIFNVFVISVFGFGMVTLLPAWAKDILGGNETLFGLILSARGLGALLGAFSLATLARYRIRGRLYTLGGFIFPILMIVFAFIRTVPVALLMLVGIGIGFMLLVNTSNALVQTSIPDHLRGRVMSVFTLLFFGGMPLGSAVTGNVAEYLDATTAVVINAAILLVFFVVIFVRQPGLRRLE